jgi:hypothetical protein
MVEAESIMGWNEVKPQDSISIGEEYSLTGDTAKPEDFANAHGQMNQ